MSDSQRLLDVVRDDFVTDLDGFAYYLPQRSTGLLSPWMLRAIADELDQINLAWNREIDEYFRTHP